MAQFRIGFIGFGRQIQNYILPIVREHYGAWIPFLVKNKRSTEYCEKHQLIQCSDLEELYLRHKVTHLFIATSRFDNHNYLQKAIDLGIPHIFVEKPVVLTPLMLELMIEAARSKNVYVTIGMNFRFAPILLDALQLANANGGIAHAEVEFISSPIIPKLNESPVAAAILEFGIHAFDIYFSILGGCLSSVPEVKTVGPGLLITGTGRGEYVSGSLKIGTYGDYFRSRITLIAMNGLTVDITNFDKATIFYSKRSSSLQMPSGRETLVYRYPTRKSSLIKCGYSELVDQFLLNKSTVGMESIIPTYRAYGDLMKSIGDT